MTSTLKPAVKAKDRYKLVPHHAGVTGEVLSIDIVDTMTQTVIQTVQRCIDDAITYDQADKFVERFIAA